MTWYYTDKKGKQAGPVSEEQFQALISSGLISADTLVWKDGFPEWVKFSNIVLSPGGEISGITNHCHECGGKFSQDEMVNFDGAWVCAACKPVYVQKLREGAPTGLSSQVWRSGKRLVAPIDSMLPQRCIKCNAPTDDAQVKRKLYWHHPAVYLALFVNILIYAIIALCLRKRGSTMVSICPAHRAARRNIIMVSWLLIFGGIGLFIGGMVVNATWMIIAGAVVFIGAIIFGIARGRLVYASKIDKEHVWLAGCKPEFLADFPEWTSSK